MKNENRKQICISLIFITAFILWTVAVKFIDVQEIGPRATSVGFATLNGYFHSLTGVNMTLYTITDWLGLVPVALAFGFGVLGLVQWINRKSILKVDYDILVLGVFYIIVFSAYLLFEMFVINYRPVLINGYLEASYPSSTTLLVLCVMPTSLMQLKTRIKNSKISKCISFAIIAFIIFVVVGRLISGVHWITDIIGGILLSVGLVLMYRAVCNLKTE